MFVHVLSALPPHAFPDMFVQSEWRMSDLNCKDSPRDGGAVQAKGFEAQHVVAEDIDVDRYIPCSTQISDTN